MSYLARIVCQFRGCIWRKARVGEDQSKKFCKRGCGASVAVRKRKKEMT